MNQALIVIMPHPKDAAKPWLGFSIEDSAKHFPNGGALVVSLHSTNIRFVLGEHKYLLKPGDQYDLWLLASGLWPLASGFWLLASGFWLLASGFWPSVSSL
jgi:hypothetical protein